MKKNERGLWATKFGFIMATVGSAIGLGNVWKFPYITGVHGGGAFVVTYLVCICLVGIPVMLAELIIGRSTHQNPEGAIEILASKKSNWKIIGYMGIFTAFIILSYYSVVSGWILSYIGKSILGKFNANQDAAQIASMLATLLQNGTLVIVLHFVFMAITTFIVMFGVHSGIEKASNILMPALFIMLLGLLIYALTIPGSLSALEFIFKPDFSKLTPKAVLEGLGHAFFTLSLGMGAMITYGSYLNHNQRLIPSAFLVALLDTVVALIAGVIIFSIVFTFNLEPDAGPTLIFSTLPSLFSQIPYGNIIAVLFFISLGFAALTSAISIMEVVVSFFIDKFHWTRKKVTISVGFAAFLLGILSALSFNVISEVKLPLGFLFGERPTFFDAFDKIASNILLPLGGLLIAVFVGFKVKKAVFDRELTTSEKKLVPIIKFILRFVAPALIGIVFLYGLNLTHPIFEYLGIE